MTIYLREKPNQSQGEASILIKQAYNAIYIFIQ